MANAQGATLCELVTASGRTIAYKRNAPVEASFTISHDDDAAELLLGALQSTGQPTLRCYRRGPDDTAGVLRFNGYLVPFQEDIEEQAQLTPTFRSPFARLLGEGSDRGRFTAEVADFYNGGTGTDAGQIAKSLIDTTNSVDGPTGLTTVGASFPATKIRYRTYSYANVGQEITGLTQLLDGFDFFETFVDDQGSTLAIFDVVPSLGGDNPSARFEYGNETLNNVRSVSRTTSPPINKVRVLGANGLLSERSDAGSIAQYGVYMVQTSATDVQDQFVLDDKAQALLRPRPVKTISFVPELGLENCPQFFDTFGVGDHVHLYGRRGAFAEDVSVRVNGMTIAISEDGVESAEIDDPTTPDDESALRASLDVEVIE